MYGICHHIGTIYLYIRFIVNYFGIDIDITGNLNERFDLTTEIIIKKKELIQRIDEVHESTNRPLLSLVQNLV